jgi:hypothetical protein
MKTSGFVFVVAAAVASLALSATAMVLPTEDVSETSLPEVVLEPQPEAMPEAAPEPMSDAMHETMMREMKGSSPEKHVVGEVSYISGGVGQDEASEMKQLAKSYPLEIVFVQKANREETDRIEEYLAAVKLQIKDAKGSVVLDITTDGPILLADLPSGNYLIAAEYNNVVKTNRIRISAKKHQRVVFLWPM